MNKSSHLSHLFNQALVSAELLAREIGFRTEFLKVLASHRWGSPNDAINPAEFEVCFAIICKKNQKSLDLPFFSKLSLRSAVLNLRRLHFKVTTATILST